MVVDFPESTCPMTTMLMCVFSFPILRAARGWPGRAALGRAVGTRLPFGGGCGGKRRARQKKKEPPFVPTPSQPLGKGCPPLAPPSRWTTRPGVPGLVWQLCALWVRASCPRRRPAGLFRAATSGLQVSARCRVFRHPALHRPRGDPQFPALRHRCFEGALPPPWKTFPPPSRSFQTRGHLLRGVGALGGAEGAPSTPQPGTVQVTTECLQNGVGQK